MYKNFKPVILCGGYGTRLWPLSKESFPNQFAPLINSKSLLALTIERVKNLGSPICITNEEHRAEHWIVVKGTAKLTNSDEIFLLNENQSTYISINTKDRLENSGKMNIEIIEVQSGSYLSEDDIIRFKDSYGRVS